MKIRTALSSLTICSCLLAAGPALAATKVWVGTAGDFKLNTAGNWDPSGTPAAGDIMTWSTNATGDLQLTNTASFTGYDTVGLTVNVTADHTGSLTILGNGYNANYLRLNTNMISIASGAGPFNLGNGNGSTATYILLGRVSGQVHWLTNDSANTATIGSDAYFANGGGGAHTLAFAGTGNWGLNSSFQSQNGGSLALILSSSGTVSLGGTAGAPGVSYTGTYGNVTVNSGTLRLDGANVLGTGNTLIMNGGSLDSSVADLVNSGNNAQTWSGNFTFVGTQNLDLGSGDVNLTANRTVTVSASTLTVGGAITNSFALTKAGSGTLLLNGANTYTGGTVVSNGVLKMANASALGASGANLTVHGTLDLNGNSPTVGNLSGNSTGVIDDVAGAGSDTLTVSNSSSSTFSGVIKNTSGTLALSKTGASTLTLAGANTYSGTTAVNEGTLLVNGSLGATAVTVASGATLGGTNTIGGTVDWQSGSSALFTLTPTTAVVGSNSTPLTVSGAVTLNGNSLTVNVAGGTPLAPGDYTLMNYNNTGSSGAFAATPAYTGAGVQPGTASTVSTSAGKVTLSVALTGVSSTWTNNGDGNWSVGANWSSNPNVPQAAGDGATLGVGSAYTTVALNTPVSLGVVNFTNTNSFSISDSGNTLTFDNTGVGAAVAVTGGTSNVIASAVALNDNLGIASGAGTSLAITNTISNTSGAKTLTKSGAGTLVLSGNNTYGPSVGTVGSILGGGGILQLNNGSAIGAGDLSVSSSATVRAGAALTLANNIIASPGVTATVDDNGNSVALSGVISGAGNLTKNGAGTVALNTANTYFGTTTVNAGTLKQGVAGAVGQGDLTVNTNGTTDLNGFSTAVNGLRGMGSVDSLAGGAVTLTIGVSNAAQATFQGAIKNGVAGVALVKDGTGTQIFTGTNTYAGGTTINAGTLQVGDGGTSGNLGSGTVTNNANLTFNLAATNVFASQMTGTGAVTLANASLNLWLTGNNASWSGPINFTAGNLWVTNTAGLGIGPKIIQPSNPNSTVHLDGSLGNLNVDSSITFNLSGTSGVLFNEAGSNTISGPVGLVYGNGNPFIKVNSGFLTLAGTVTAVNPRTLILGGAGDGLISGNYVDSSAGVLTKQDAGTWTLAGTGNTYSGATTVNGGTLIISGDSTGTGAFAVNSGGTLIVNGNTYGSGAVTVATNGTLGGVGFIYSTTTLQEGSKGKFRTSASLSTPLTIYGNVILTNNVMEVYVEGGTPLPPGQYTLLVEGNTSLYAISGSAATTAVITGAGLQAGTQATVTSSATEVKLVVYNTSTWTFDGNGNWTTGANWSSNPNYPDSAGEFGILGVGSSLITINLNASQTIGGLNFTNANSFVITNSANTLTLNNNTFGSGITVSAGTANSIATPVSLDDATSVGTAVGSSLSIPGNVSGSASVSFSGGGVVSLSGSNSHSGGTALSGGTLILGSTNAVGSGTLTLAGGSLDSSLPNLANANNNPQNWNGNFTFIGSQSLNLGTGGVTAGSTEKTVTVNSNSLTVGGSVSGTARINKAGAGTLVLLAANGGHSGGIGIQGGTMIIGDDSAVGTGTLEFASADATLQSTDSTARTLANAINLTAGGIYAGTGNLTFSGAVTSGQYQKIIAISNAVTTFSGTIDGTNTADQANAKQGPGTLVLSGDNSNLTKRFEVNEGTLAIGSATALGTGAVTMFGGGLDSTVASLINSGNNALRWSGNFYFAGSQNLNLGTGSVTMTTNTIITVSNNTLTVGGAVSGATRSLTKSGAGTLVLSGANTYSNTTVTAGTLAIAQATLATNSTVGISNSAVLQLNFSTTNQVAKLVLNGVNQPNGVYGSSTPGGYLAGTGYLRVQAMGPSAPATLVSSLGGSTLSLSWPAGEGWRLQVQTNSRSIGLSNNWNYMTDGSVSSTNITINQVDPTVFYRLVYP